jgi:hypothetical protein
MTAPVAPKVAITKLEAARRQLRVAISLWFQDGDEVSIHTLACTAHEIINAHVRSTSRLREQCRSLMVLLRAVGLDVHSPHDTQGIASLA